MDRSAKDSFHRLESFENCRIVDTLSNDYQVDVTSGMIQPLRNGAVDKCRVNLLSKRSQGIGDRGDKSSGLKNQAVELLKNRGFLVCLVKFLVP